MVFGMEVATLTALVAMIISVLAASAKILDRWKARKAEKLEENAKQTTLGPERDSIVVRGAEGALLLMQKTMQTASTECDKRIQELEEENSDLRCEVARMREEIKESRKENAIEIKELRDELKELTTKVRRG